MLEPYNVYAERASNGSDSVTCCPTAYATVIRALLALLPYAAPSTLAKHQRCTLTSAVHFLAGLCRVRAILGVRLRLQVQAVTALLLQLPRHRQVQVRAIFHSLPAPEPGTKVRGN